MTTDDYLEHESDDTAIYSEAVQAEELRQLRERLDEQNLTQHRLEEYLGDEHCPGCRNPHCDQCRDDLAIREGR